MPKVEPSEQSTAPSATGWFETRQALQNELQTEHEMNMNKTFGGFSIRTTLVVYLAMTLVVMLGEGTFIVLYFADVISDPLHAAAEKPGISTEEREFYLDLEAKQFPWLIVQLAWYCLGILFAGFGFFALYTRRLDLFKIFQVWLFGHIVAYFVTAIIFEQMTPVALHVFGYVILTMFFALANVYAGHLSIIYKKQLSAIVEKEKRFENRPVINEIASPV